MGSSRPRVIQPSTIATEPAPKKTDRAVQEALSEAMNARKRARGFRSTILSRDFMNEETAKNLQSTLGS